MWSNLSNPIKAGFWMLGAMISFTLMAISGRSLADKLDTFEIMTYRSFIGIAIVLLFAYRAGTLGEVRTRYLKLHIIRNIFHFSGQNLWFFAILYVPLSQMFVFEFSTPLWVAVCAPLVLGERLTLSRFMAAAIGFFGILVVARPDFSDVNPAIIAAALCAVGFAGATLATKILTRTETITAILFWLTVLQAVFGVICAGYDGVMDVPRGSEWLWVVIIGICGLCAHFCITTALQLAPATIVTPFEFLRLPLITFVGVVLYGEQLEWLVFLGAFIVLLANIMNIRAETRASKSAISK
ncbi:MAG: Riboflavin transporter [Rhodospirillaceae bacterium]|nr:MAG: Riboflavin transporter [Rhodospirillaceae bacterium]